MKISFRIVVKKVKQKIKQIIWENIISYFTTQRLNLWGEQQPDDFQYNMVVITIFKDLFKISFSDLLSDYDMGFHLSKTSLEHNIKVIRRILSEWGDEKIMLGDCEDWDARVKRIKIGKKVEGTNLWIDSTDYPMRGMAEIKKKHPEWSFKLNHRGRRYMYLRDGWGVICGLWGGYSPKFFDGGWLELQKRWLETNVQGGVVCGDQHFEWGKTGLSNVKFYTPFKKPAKLLGEKRKRTIDVAVLTKEQLQFNQQQRATRARIEDCFGWFARTFVSLEKPWEEEKEQLDCLIIFSIGIWNMMMLENHS